MDIRKAERLIVKDSDNNIICNIEIGMVSIKMQDKDKGQVLTIKQAK